MQTSRLYCCVIFMVVHIGQISARISANFKLKCNQRDRCQTRIRHEMPQHVTEQCQLGQGSRARAQKCKCTMHSVKKFLLTHIFLNQCEHKRDRDRQTDREREERKEKKNTASRDRNLHLFVGLQVVPGEYLV